MCACVGEPRPPSTLGDSTKATGATEVAVTIVTSVETATVTEMGIETETATAAAVVVTATAIATGTVTATMATTGALARPALRTDTRRLDHAEAEVTAELASSVCSHPNEINCADSGHCSLFILID